MFLHCAQVSHRTDKILVVFIFFVFLLTPVVFFIFNAIDNRKESNFSHLTCETDRKRFILENYRYNNSSIKIYSKKFLNHSPVIYNSSNFAQLFSNLSYCFLNERYCALNLSRTNPSHDLFCYFTLNIPPSLLTLCFGWDLNLLGGFVNSTIFLRSDIICFEKLLKYWHLHLYQNG